MSEKLLTFEQLVLDCICNFHALLEFATEHMVWTWFYGFIIFNAFSDTEVLEVD